MTKLQKLLNGRNPTAGSGGDNAVAAVESSQAAAALAAATLIVNNNIKIRNEQLQQLNGTAASQFVLNPTQYDVLFGRGKPYQGHAGNQRLHKIVDVYKPRYSKARRHEKTEIAEEIVQYIKTGDGASSNAGRFLRRVEGEEYWTQVSDSIARDKVSHALRGKPPSGPGTRKKQASKSIATIKQKKSTSTEPRKHAMKKEQKEISSSAPVAPMGPSDLELIEAAAAAAARRGSNPLLNNALLAGTSYPPSSTASLLLKRPSLDLKSQMLATALLNDRLVDRRLSNAFNPRPLVSLQSLLGRATGGGGGSFSTASDPRHAILFGNNPNCNIDPSALLQLRRSSDASFGGGFYR